MKIGITQLCLGGLSLEQCLDFCRDAGYEAIELKFGPGGDPDMGGQCGRYPGGQACLRRRRHRDRQHPRLGRRSREHPQPR